MKLIAKYNKAFRGFGKVKVYKELWFSPPICKDYKFTMAKKHKLVIVGWFKFPFGSAAASRIRTLAQGLSQNGFEVLVLTTARISLRNEDVTYTGESYWRDIQYQTENCYERNDIKSSRVQRLVSFFKATCKSWISLYNLSHSSEIDGIIIYGRSFISYLPIIIFAKIHRIPIFYDVVEWFPMSRFKYGILNPFFYDDWLGRHLPLLSSQGVLTITTYIANKYTHYKIPCLILPSIFDYSLSQHLEVIGEISKNDIFTVLYAGTCKPGDGFENLLNAIKLASYHGCPIRLDVLGTEGLSGLAKKHRQACEKDVLLRSRVRFLGRVNDTDYLPILHSADCLVLPRPDCQIVRASFPTRLPEFLSTGRPVLTTDVPDIPRYLDAGIHAEIVQGDTPEALASGILRLWKDPDRAYQIGIAGQKRGREVFDYRQHSESVSKFIFNNL